MKRLIIEWKERLEELYIIAGDSGMDAEGCDYEWFDLWKPEKCKGYQDVEIIPIPDKEWKKFEKYANS